SALESAAVELVRAVDEGLEDQPEPFRKGSVPKPDQYGDYRTYAAELSRTVMDRLQLVKESRHASRAVERIKMYLHEQYKEELDLQRLAEHVHLTPSYLSKLFKGETGETITDFAISVRIHHAKRLLREEHGLKTYEVGERVGYPDPAYFTKVFKRMTGKTPKEYRDSVR
ncbi:helix-turn-helix domain-containing protein, partial [Paenibacillus sepulcri]|nr:helix-turn-helix domain-containing protein [Paenibacillus sepulcri]